MPSILNFQRAISVDNYTFWRRALFLTVADQARLFAIACIRLVGPLFSNVLSVAQFGREIQVKLDGFRRDVERDVIPDAHHIPPRHSSGLHH